MSKCRNIVITGANRGIGLELVKQIITRFQPDHLIATYRDEASAKDLLELGKQHKNVHPVVLDVGATEKFADFAKIVEKLTQGAGVNLLINNAGIAHIEKSGTLSELEEESILYQFKINCVAPMMLSKALLPQLEKASEQAGKSGTPLGIRRAVILNVSSTVGTIGGNTMGGIYGYRISKSALNQASKNMSLDLKGKGILVIPLHPGWVKTDMGGPNAQIETSESASGILTVLEKANEEITGHFMKWDGTEDQW